MCGFCELLAGYIVGSKERRRQMIVGMNLFTIFFSSAFNEQQRMTSQRENQLRFADSLLNRGEVADATAINHANIEININHVIT